MGTKIFVIYHDKQVLDSIQSDNKILLGDLPIGEFQINALAENRFLWFLSNNINLINTDFIGIAAASWNTKYSIKKIEELKNIQIQKNQVFVADKVANWYNASENCHPGMGKLIKEICQRNKFKIKGDSFWSNNFICHAEIMKNFLEWWRKEFLFFFEKYKIDPPFTNKWPHYKPNLHCAYFFERLTVTYFANQPLNIIQI